MSTVEISLRIFGELPPLHELTQRLKVEPTTFLRGGEFVSKRRIQPVDMWSLDLLRYESDDSEINQKWINVALAIRRLAPAIATFDRTHCKTDLFISTTREEDQGGLSLPSELVSAAAAANLSIEVSILVMLDDYDDEPNTVQVNEVEQLHNIKVVR